MNFVHFLQIMYIKNLKFPCNYSNLKNAFQVHIWFGVVFFYLQEKMMNAKSINLIFSASLSRITFLKNNIYFGCWNSNNSEEKCVKTKELLT